MQTNQIITKSFLTVSICAVVLLVLGSLSNVVGYQTVQSSNKQIINEEVNQKELLFQTIVDIANNKELQRIILKHQLSRGEFPVSNIPVLTKNQLMQIYFIGLMLSKIISKSRIHSLLEPYQVSNQEMQKEITAIIEKDATLNAEITQLSNLECDCENENTTTWFFPVLCMLLLPLFIVLFFLMKFFPSDIAWTLIQIIVNIGHTLNCLWSY
jgi:hypothetical protein